MKTWYIRNNDEHLGPYSIEELRLVGLYSDDYVWREGLPKWTKANAVSELRDLLISVENSLFPPDKNPRPDYEKYTVPRTHPAGEMEPQPVNFLEEAGKKILAIFRRKKQ